MPHLTHSRGVYLTKARVHHPQPTPQDSTMPMNTGSAAPPASSSTRTRWEYLRPVRFIPFRKGPLPPHYSSEGVDTSNDPLPPRVSPIRSRKMMCHEHYLTRKADSSKVRRMTISTRSGVVSCTCRPCCALSLTTPNSHLWGLTRHHPTALTHSRPPSQSPRLLLVPPSHPTSEVPGSRNLVTVHRCLAGDGCLTVHHRLVLQRNLPIRVGLD